MARFGVRTRLTSRVLEQLGGLGHRAVGVLVVEGGAVEASGFRAAGLGGRVRSGRDGFGLVHGPPVMLRPHDRAPRRPPARETTGLQRREAA